VASQWVDSQEGLSSLNLVTDTIGKINSTIRFLELTHLLS
jgi:hypothetical protein